MPIINVKFIKDVVATEEQKAELIVKLTDTFVGVLGDVVRPFTYVVIDETPVGQWGIAGVPMPDLPNTEKTLAELKARLTKTIDFCKSIKPDQIDGTEDKDIVLKLGDNERKFKGQTLLLNFILPNFYFHCTTAYDLLRHAGIDLAKRDFMGTPPTL